MRHRILKNKFFSLLAGTAIAASSIAGVQLISAQPAAAAACISVDNGHGWGPTASTTNSKSPTWTTTVNCRDINVNFASYRGDTRPTGRIRICFVGAGYCQSSWKTLQTGTHVIATNVADGTTYRVEIDWTGAYGTSTEFGVYA